MNSRLGDAQGRGLGQYEELRAHVRGRLAGYKVPDRIEFGPLSKTGSGKIRKFELRAAAWAGRDRLGPVGPGGTDGV